MRGMHHRKQVRGFRNRQAVHSGNARLRVESLEERRLLSAQTVSLPDFSLLAQTRHGDSCAAMIDADVKVVEGVSLGTNLLEGTGPELAGIESTALSYTEKDPPTAITATITASDASTPALVRATIQITANYQSGLDVLSFTNTQKIRGIWDSRTGRLTLTGTDTVANYEAALREVKYRNASATPSPAARTVTFQVNDGTADSNKLTRTIEVTPVDDPPVLTRPGLGPMVYVEGKAAKAITTTIAVRDADDTNLAGATVQITGNYQAGYDVLSFADTKNIKGTWDAAAGKMTLAGNDTLANYQKAMRSVKYANLSQDPSTAPRSVTFLASDGAKTSSPLTRTVSVRPVNQRPVLSGIETTPVSYAKNQAATAITATIAANDADDTTLAVATVQITGGYQRGGDVLALAGTATLTTAWDTRTGRLTIRGIDTLAAYEAALRAVTYQNTSTTPSTAVRTVTFTVFDGLAWSKRVTRTVHWITPVLAASASRQAPIQGVPTAATDAALLGILRSLGSNDPAGQD